MDHSTKVLIVDDAASVRALLRALLQNEGFQVVGELASGNGLLETINKLRPNIICLDHNLPGSSGLELLTAVQENHREVSVIMITGDASGELDEHAAELGAAGFLRKPFTQEHITREFHQVVLAQQIYKSHGKDEIRPPRPRAAAVVIDDSATMRSLLAAILRSADIEVIGQAMDGKQGADLILRAQPDIVCLDMDMPVMNGIEVLKSIRGKAPRGKVLMITGRADRELVVHAVKFGASGYILKPFDPEKIIQAVNRILSPQQ